MIRMTGISYTIETVSELHACQTIIPDWMRNLGAPDDLVRVKRRQTFAGIFVISAEPWTMIGAAS